MASATVKVWEVLHNTTGAGAYGDGMATARFRSERDARAFAAGHRCYSAPAEARLAEVPRRIAQRWGMA